jgi:single-stranded-DNA-specific exonuclease
MRLIRRRPVSESLCKRLPEDLTPLLRRLYAARGVAACDDLARTLDALHPATQLAGMEGAAALLCEAIEKRSHILIVADFDADGATSCALAVRALRAFGAARVSYLVPNRFEYGYGLTPEIVAVAACSAPDLLVTVDNGISSLEGVEAARECGMRVIVTDHHLPGARLPAADAIVNPNQPGDTFPSKHLCGVGVMFYVLSALRAELRARGWFARQGITEPNLAQWLDLVALGTVADVVPLDRNNRILVGQGLARIRAGRCSPGIAALLQVGGRQRERITAGEIGFAVAPRLNAAGRLEDMALGIECLLCDDESKALELAQRLDALNVERRAIEDGMKAQALDFLDALSDELDGALPFGLALHHAEWHQGVIGILAARVREQTHRPTICFAEAGDGTLKGSARSVPGLHIRDVLDAIAARHPGLISKFGGHAMAAGLALPAAHLADFSRAFDEEVRHTLSEEDLVGVVWSDGELTAGELTLDNAERLRDAGPWGQHFPEPAFDGRFEVRARRILKERHMKMGLCAQGSNRALDAIAFGLDPELWPEVGQQIRVVYRLDVNEYQGVRRPQLVIEHLEPA